MTESIIPEPFTKPQGILLGTATQNSKKQNIYFPLENKDLASKMWVNIGGSRSGKSTAAINRTIGALECGRSVIYLDPTGEAAEIIRDSVPKSLLPDSHILCFDFNREDYLPAIHWPTPKGDNIIASDKRTNYMIQFLDRFAETKMGDRTKRYFRASLKLNTDILNATLMFANRDYALKRLETTKDPTLIKTWQTYWKKNIEKETYAEPVISRLDSLISDDIIANCILQPPKYTSPWDMHKWLNGDFILGKRTPYCVLITLPSNKESMNTLATYLMQDILLAALQRNQIPSDKRELAFVMIDEPHQMLGAGSGGANSIWSQMAAELPKYRVGIHFYLHSLISEQIPSEVKKVIRGADPHYSLFITDKDEFKALADEFAPIDLEEFMVMPQFDSLNRLWHSGTKHNLQLTNLPPPIINKKTNRLPYTNRAHLALETHKRYGRPITEIRTERYKRQELLYS